MSDFFNTREEVGAIDTMAGAFFKPQTEEDADLFFRTAQSAMEALNMSDAAANLRRYRSGSGERRVFSTEEIDRYPRISQAEDTNRSRFESRTFTGQTGKEDAINRPLRTLDDGQSFDFDDDWVRGIGPLPDLRALHAGPEFATVEDIQEAHRELERALTLGSTAIRSRGQFRATRRGDDVEINGTVRHGFQGTAGYNEDEEAFDFNPGQPGDPQARILERAGRAAPFAMSYSKLQNVSAQLRREPNGTLVLRRAAGGAMR